MATLLLPPGPRALVLLVLLASFAVVGTALLSQYAGGLVPCELCLYQRWPYYAVIVATIAALLTGSPAAMREILLLCGLIFGAGLVLALYHVGVELHWFAGPSACTGSGTGAQTIEELRQQLMNRQPVNCDEPAWRLFGVSMAGWNALASLLLAVFCFAAAQRLGRQRRGRPA